MFDAMPIKIPMSFITVIEKSNLKFTWKHKRQVKALLSPKRKTWTYHNTNFKLYYRAIAIKTAWYCHKNRYDDKWNKIQEPDMNT
jgi:hypothetical protein